MTFDPKYDCELTRRINSGVIDPEEELLFRQKAASFIQDVGQRLKVTQLCINTGVVYMHRFYTFHSFSKFHVNPVAAACIFVSAKVEEQPRTVHDVLTAVHWCLCSVVTELDSQTEVYMMQATELLFNESVLLPTLGFDLVVDHPHTHIIRCCNLIGVKKEVAQSAYMMASHSLHLTTMCLKYKPTVVACVCIQLSCKWANWEIPQLSEGKDWFNCLDSTISLKQLEQLTAELVVIFDKSMSRVKEMNEKKVDGCLMHGITGPQMEQEPTFSNDSHVMSDDHSQDGNIELASGFQLSKGSQQQQSPLDPILSTNQHSQPSIHCSDQLKRNYKEKRARETTFSSTTDNSGSEEFLKDDKLYLHMASNNRGPPYQQAIQDIAALVR